MILVMLYLAILLAWLWPHGLGDALRRQVLDLPRRILPNLTAGKVLFAVVFALALAALLGFGRSDVLMFAGQVLPEGVGWLVTFDIAAYFDVIALAWLLAATVRWRGVSQAARVWLARSLEVLSKRMPHRAGRRRRIRRDRGKGRLSGDDDGGWPRAAAYV